MNEGWASWWHYNILKELDLEPSMHIEFLKVHNQVIRASKGRVNPYYMGFKIWEDIANKSKDPNAIFEIRALERDSSFIRRYLNFELCREMNLMQFDEQDRYYVVTEVADDDGWRKIRNLLADTVGMGSIPVITVCDVMKSNNTLHLKHIYDGRELDVTNTFETLKYTAKLWGGKVILETILNKHPKRIICSNDLKISLENI